MTPRPRDPTGDSGLVSWCRKTSDRIDELKNIAVEGGEIDRKTSGYVLRIPKQRIAEGASSSAVSVFQIAAVQNDYLQCNEISWDETGAATVSSVTTNVAKPESLRVSNLGAYTNVSSNSRTLAITGTPGITESLKPAYNVGDVIMAAKLKDRTPVLVAGKTLEWEDLNENARNWFPGYVIVNVCVNGQSQRMIVPGSGPFV